MKISENIVRACEELQEWIETRCEFGGWVELRVSTVTTAIVLNTATGSEATLFWSEEDDTADVTFEWLRERVESWAKEMYDAYGPRVPKGGA